MAFDDWLRSQIGTWNGGTIPAAKPVSPELAKMAAAIRTMKQHAGGPFAPRSFGAYGIGVPDVIENAVDKVPGVDLETPDEERSRKSREERRAGRGELMKLLGAAASSSVSEATVGINDRRQPDPNKPLELKRQDGSSYQDTSMEGLFGGGKTEKPNPPKTNAEAAARGMVLTRTFFTPADATVTGGALTTYRWCDLAGNGCTDVYVWDE